MLKQHKILMVLLSAVLVVTLSVSLSSSLVFGAVIPYGTERVIYGNWVIDGNVAEVTSEHPIYFKQDYHEQFHILVKNGGTLKISDSYIRSDSKFEIILQDSSKLIVQNSNLNVGKFCGAIIVNLDNSSVKAKNSRLEYVGIACGNRPISYLNVDVENCTIEDLDLDLFGIENIVINGLSPGTINDKTFSTKKFLLHIKNCTIERGIISWIQNSKVTFRNCRIGQVDPDIGSNVRIENCTVREVVPRVENYSGTIEGLPQGKVSSFQLNIPPQKGGSVTIVNSYIERGWYFRYFSGCNIEFKNCSFSVLRPMGNNYASVKDSTIRELWIWDTSGEIHFENSPIGWIGKIMGPNNILLSGDITVEDKNWNGRWANHWHWGNTIIKREFFFSFPNGAGKCTLKNEEGVKIDEFKVGATPISKILTFDTEKRKFLVYLDGVLVKTLELSSDAKITLTPVFYTINSSSSSGGSISPSGKITVKKGDNKIFVITPDTGYHIKDVIVDNASVITNLKNNGNGSYSYVFNNVTANHTISVLFERNKIVITLKPGDPYMTVNGVKQEIDPGRGIKPVIIPKWGRTVVPIRAIVEALGGTIEWDGTERKVTINFNGTVIELWIDNPKAKVNGVTKWIDENNHDVKPIIVNSRTMLPLRFVAESLGCEVNWDAATRTITITYTP